MNAMGCPFQALYLTVCPLTEIHVFRAKHSELDGNTYLAFLVIRGHHPLSWRELGISVIDDPAVLDLPCRKLLIRLIAPGGGRRAKRAQQTTSGWKKTCSSSVRSSIIFRLHVCMLWAMLREKRYPLSCTSSSVVGYVHVAMHK